jgi:hypothetical protein
MKLTEILENTHFQLRIVRDSTDSGGFGGDRDVPYAKLIFLHGMRGSAPIICGRRLVIVTK